MLRAALKGFGSARQRFLAQATPGAAPEDVFVSLSEALWWTVSADDGFEHLARIDPGYRPNLGDYRQARDTKISTVWCYVACGMPVIDAATSVRSSQSRPG